MTENYLRLGLLLIAAVIVFLILFEAWHKRRHLKMMKSFELPAQSNLSDISNMFLDEHIEPTVQSATPKAELEQDLLMISILAKPGCQFASYDLFQSILAAGFQFGDMNLFHYFQSSQDGSTKLFSLASTTQSGEFDMNNIGEFSCKGLILFLDLNAIIEPKRAFELMLKTAEQLSDDLDGELRADPHTPWDEGVFNRYQKKISDKKQSIQTT